MKSRSIMSTIALGLGLSIGLLTILAHPSQISRADPTFYYVREGASGTACTLSDPCGSIQQAIDLATSPDDEVRVTTGVYIENLAINHSIKLQGGWNSSFSSQDPASTATVLDGDGDHNVRIDAPAAEVTIETLTLDNGKDGVHIDNGSVTVERCTILNAEKQGFEIDDGTVSISATQILTAQQGIEIDGGVVHVAHVHIAHTSQEGLFIENGGAVTVTFSIIEDCGQEGVQVDKGSLWLFDNTVQDIVSDGIRIQADAATSIISNVVRGVAENAGADYHGIQVDGDQVVRGNVVADVDDRGICARDGAPRILDNVVHDTGGDGIRTAATCTDVEIRGNTVYDSGNDGIDARGESVIIAGNTVTGCTDNGIKADLISDWVYIDANWGLSNGVGIAIRDALAFTFTNNVVGDNVSSGVELSGTATGLVYHNTLVGSGTGAQGNGMVILSPLTATLANNIIVSHSVGITATTGATLIVSNTLLWANGDDPISGTAVLPSPPLFVAPAQQDYHLLSESPAVDAGIDVGVSADVDGDGRPVGPRPDVGADEVRLRFFLPHILRNS
jgi:hypothetical protein